MADELKKYKDILDRERKGVQETVGERGKYLLVLSNRSKKQDCKLNVVGIFITSLPKLLFDFFPKFYGVISDMKLHWLYMKGKWGQNLKRYAILVFFF